MSVVCAVVISFRDKESVSIQNCPDKVFVCLINICAVGYVGDEILNMLFKLCPIDLLVVCYYFSKVKASCFGIVMYRDAQK